MWDVTVSKRPLFWAERSSFLCGSSPALSTTPGAQGVCAAGNNYWVDMPGCKCISAQSNPCVLIKIVEVENTVTALAWNVQLVWDHIDLVTHHTSIPVGQRPTWMDTHVFCSVRLPRKTLKIWFFFLRSRKHFKNIYCAEILKAWWHTWQERMSAQESLAFPLLPHVLADCLRLRCSLSQNGPTQLRVQCVAQSSSWSFLWKLLINYSWIV